MPVIALTRATALSLLRNGFSRFLFILACFFMAGALLMLSFDIGVRYRLLENTLLASQCFLLHLFA